jgi:His/Glu/Gln/Arg/opine family amino acid ABC transporter permease subunit
VVLGETYEHYLREHHRAVRVVTYKSSTDIFQDMFNRRLDGFVTDRLVGGYQIKQSGRPFVPAGPLLYVERMAIPVTRDNPELLAGINEAIQAMKTDGSLDRIHEKWFGFTDSEGPRESSMQTGVILEKLAKGFGITLLVAVLSIVMGFMLSVPLGVILNNPKFPLHIVFRSINDFIRGTPVLIQLFFVYFGTPQIGIALSPIQAAVITLTINTSAYMSEVIRSGLMSVDYGQFLAGRALGLNRYQVFLHVIWPQAFRVALPPLMNSVVALIKDTALIAIISVAEVVREAQSIISVTYDPMKYYFIVGLMFFVVTFPLMKLSGRLERRIRQKGFTHD